MSKTYTVKQVAEILGYSTNSIYTFLQEGRIKGVRVGKGRFRIPEEELSRVLQLSKKKDLIQAPTVQPEVVEKKVIVSEETPVLQPITPEIRLHGLHIVSIFDWFVASASIVLGFSLILYSQKKSGLEFAEFIPWLRTLQISFVAGGLGLFITDIFHKKISYYWNKIFQLILVFVYAFFAFINFQVNDIGGLLIFGIIAGILAFKLVFPLSGIQAFIFYLFFYGLGVLAVLLLGLPTVLPNEIAQLFMVNKAILSVIWIVLDVFILLVLLLGRQKPSILFWMFMLGLGLVMTTNSVLFATQLAWSKSFFLLISGLTCFLLPVWLALRVAHENQRRSLVYVYGLMLVILILGVGVIWIMQRNMAEYAGRDLKSRVDFGGILLDERIKKVEKNLKEAGTNELLIQATKEEKTEELTELLKLVYSSNEDIEKIFVLKADVSILATYPFAEDLSSSDFADLVAQTISEEDVKFFDNYKPAKDMESRAAMSIPLTDQEGNTNSVLVAQIDLAKLKNDLQELANPLNDEYFVVYNSAGKIIVNQDKGINFSTDPAVDNELVEVYNYQGERAYQVSKKLDNLGWTIQINSSVEKIFAPTKIVSISIFLVTVMFVGGLGLWLVAEKHKYA